MSEGDATATCSGSQAGSEIGLNSLGGNPENEADLKLNPRTLGRERDSHKASFS